MKITIEDKTFQMSRVRQLYPAALIKTDGVDETTQASLEWVENESKGAVEVVGYGVFVHLDDEQKFSFVYETKEQMDELVAKIADQLKESR